MELLEILNSCKDPGGRIALSYSAVTQNSTVLRAPESLQATDNFKPDPVRGPAEENEGLSSLIYHKPCTKRYS